MYAINLKDLIKNIEKQDPAIARLYRAKNINLKSSDFFKINSTDTVVIMINKNGSTSLARSNPKVYIWSNSDSTYLKYSKDGYSVIDHMERENNWSEIKRYNEICNFNEYDYGAIRPEFYEKQLLLDGDIDSIRILKQYDRIFYYSPIYNNVYRFIIKRNKIVNIDYFTFSGAVPPPDKYVDVEELKFRNSIREKLQREDSAYYNRIFLRQH